MFEGVNVGQRVRARVAIYDRPGLPDPGPLRADPGDEGVVVHVQDGCWPTVDFPGGATCVTADEVELL